MRRVLLALMAAALVAGCGGSGSGSQRRKAIVSFLESNSEGAAIESITCKKAGETASGEPVEDCTVEQGGAHHEVQLKVTGGKRVEYASP